MHPGSGCFSFYSNSLFSDCCHHDVLWAVVSPETIVAALFTFLVIAREGIPDIFNTGDGPRLIALPVEGWHLFPMRFARFSRNSRLSRCIASPIMIQSMDMLHLQVPEMFFAWITEELAGFRFRETQ